MGTGLSVTTDVGIGRLDTWRAGGGAEPAAMGTFPGMTDASDAAVSNF